VSAKAAARALSVVRAADWWAYKIPPLLVTAYAGALIFDGRDRGWLPTLAAFLAILFVAVYGYVLNDVCDIEADRQSARPNRMATVAPALRVALLAGSALGALGLTATTDDVVMVGLVAANLLLPTLYSVPPIRLKGRGLLGALADAGGVHTLPMALIGRASVLDAEAPFWLTAVFVASAVGWALFAGLRGIVIHQVLDIGADKLADVTTFVGRIGVDHAKRLVFRVFLPAEILSLLVFLALTLPSAPVAAVFVLVFASLEIEKVRRGWKLKLFDRTGTESYVPVVNNEIYEVWLPLAFAVQLAVRSPVLWLLPIVQVVVFWTNLRNRAGSLTALLPDSWFRRAEARPHSLPAADYRVVVGTTVWTVNGVNVFSVNLARQLMAGGIDARIVVTEQETDLINWSEHTMPIPGDVALEFLPVGRRDGWGTHWGTMVRYLEDRAPCIYLPNHDWRHACIVPQLDDDVIVVGILHSDDPLHYDHLQRMGRYWNAVVAVSDAIAAKAAALCPELAERITTIPIGVRVPALRPARTTASDRLRVIYHGILKQAQKRVFDLPRIASAAVDLGVPIELSIVGSGPDEAELRAIARPLVDAGVIRFVGVTAPDDMPALLTGHDVYLLASEFEGMPNALIEAMAHGLVPVVSRMPSGIPELVRDGESGFLVPVGDEQAFARALLRLWSEPVLRERMAAQAFKTVKEGKYGVEVMALAYRVVFDRALEDARTGRFVRPRGPIAPLPADVAGIGIFPVDTPHQLEGVGAFPSREDADDYRRQLRRRHATGAGPLRCVPVFVGVQSWTANPVRAWAEELVQGLRARGVDASILLTEEPTGLVSSSEPPVARPSDLPITELEIDGPDTWGSRWGALVRTLESAAPCIYITGPDWRHAVVTPVLSNRVAVIGVLHDAGQVSMDHLARLGHAWNAIVTTSRAASDSIRATLPQLTDRVLTVPGGVNVPADPVRKVWDGQRPMLLAPFGGTNALADAATALSASGDLAVVAVDPPEDVRGPLEATGARVVSFPNRSEWFALCEACHFVLDDGQLTPEAQVFEAMGRGCIPVVCDSTSSEDASRRGREAGLFVRPGDWDVAIQHIAAVGADDERRSALADRAHYLAWRASFRSDEMVEAFLDVFDRVLAAADVGSFQRPAGMIAPPPAVVGGVSIFTPPAGPLHIVEGVGAFPTEADAEAYAHHIRMIGAHPSRWRPIPPAEARTSLAGVRVFVAAPAWTCSGLNLWAEDLVRLLSGAGLDARLLLTEESTPLVNVDVPRMARPDDIRVDELRVSGVDNWGARWGALLRLLEEAAPCIYVPSYDWRHAAIVPILSDQVSVIGMLPGSDELHFEQVTRLAASLNAVVVWSHDVAAQARARLEGIRTTVVIPWGADIPAHGPQPRANHGVRITLVGGGRDVQVGWAQGLVDYRAASGGPPWSIGFVDPDPAPEAHLAEIGVERLARLNRAQWMTCCEASDFVVALDSTHETRRRLVEAMGHGCIPVVTDSEMTRDGLIRDGVNGIKVPTGPVTAALDRIRTVATDGALRERMRREAHRSVLGSDYRADQMLEAYLDLFARVRAEVQAGAFSRPSGGVILPPPARVADRDVFPVALDFATSVGVFPSPEDARRFAEESGRTIPGVDTDGRQADEEGNHLPDDHHDGDEEMTDRGA
jgi:glycosyltransferase involved in cell wall biosynthesis